MEDMDELVAEGRHIFQVSDRVDADSQFKAWEDHVCNWLSVKFPKSGLSAKWSSLGFSNLICDNSVGSASEEWLEFREMVRGRLEWLARLPNSPNIVEGKMDINLAESSQQKSQLPLSDTITLSWLWQHVPAKFWIWASSTILAVFLIGVYAGQIHWVQYLYRGDTTKSSEFLQKGSFQGMDAKPAKLSPEDLDQALQIVSAYRSRIHEIRDSINKGGKATQDRISVLRQDYQKLIAPYIDLLQLHQPGKKEWHGYNLEYDNPLDLALTEPTFFHLNLSLGFLDKIIGKIGQLKSHPEIEQ